jgi:hypothetical protein
MTTQFLFVKFVLFVVFFKKGTANFTNWTNKRI